MLSPVQLAAELVRIGSVNPAGQEVRNNTFGEAAIGGRVKAILRGLGADPVETTYPLPGRPNVLGYFDFAAARTVIFEAHLDTVPTTGMTVDAFGGEVREGKLWGRGACDVKGPMAAMLWAIDAAKESGDARYNVLFAAVCDEEAGFSGVRYMLEHLRPEWKSNIAFAVVAEPTQLQPLVAHKGVVRWSVTARGLATHSSTPELGRNAIYTMADVIVRLQSHAGELGNRLPDKKPGAPSLSVGTIRGGSAVNIVPDACTIHIDRRLVPGESVASAESELRALLAGLPGITLSDPIVAAPAFRVEESSAAVQACLAAARALQLPAAPQFANYCTDASFYAEHGIEAVVFGPGDIAQAHTADEWICVDALDKGAAAYLKILSPADVN